MNITNRIINVDHQWFLVSSQDRPIAPKIVFFSSKSADTLRHNLIPKNIIGKKNKIADGIRIKYNTNIQASIF